MPRRMKDLLAKRAQENFVGRTEEMASLLQCLEDECPLVVHIHGIGGVGEWGSLPLCMRSQLRYRDREPLWSYWIAL